jgi:hypothetical protein
MNCVHRLLTVGNSSTENGSSLHSPFVDGDAPPHIVRFWGFALFWLDEMKTVGLK